MARSARGTTGNEIEVDIPEQTTAPSHEERPAASKPGKSEKASKAEKASKSEKASKAEDPSKTENLSKTENPSKAERKALKGTAKAQQKAAKAEQTSAKAEIAEQKRAAKNDKRAQKAKEKGEYGRVTPGNAKKLLGIAKVLGPALAPFALRAASAARESYDRARAHHLGVAVDDLGRFSGRGAGLHARIAGLNNALDDLRTRATGSEGEPAIDRQFADTGQDRLQQLASATRAAEQMPGPRRKAAHRAVAGELDRLEEDLLNRFGIPVRP